MCHPFLQCLTLVLNTVETVKLIIIQIQLPRCAPFIKAKLGLLGAIHNLSMKAVNKLIYHQGDMYLFTIEFRK